MSQHVRDMLDGAEYGHTGTSMRWVPAEGDRWAANPRPPARTPVTLVVDEYRAPTREQLAALFDVPVQVTPVISPSLAARLEAAWPALHASMTRMMEAVAQTIRPLQELAGQLGYDFDEIPDPREHALWAAQHRNTGPPTVPATQAHRPRTHAHGPAERPPPRRARNRRRA